MKTSTGLLVCKATGKDVTLTRKTVGASMGVKASAGIRTVKGGFSNDRSRRK